MRPYRYRFELAIRILEILVSVLELLEFILA